MPKVGTRWVEISVEVDRASVDDIAAFMGRHCRGGAVVEDNWSEASQQPGERVTVKGFLADGDEETLRKLEIALLLLGRTSPISEPRVRTLEPEDWAESWKVYFLPQHIGAHTVIVPTWHDYTPGPGDTVIRLDPGMAFGTGLHATTRLCLLAIERAVRPGMRVLDVGTGSGILAISAALEGASEVYALDMDPVSVEVARENADLNEVADRVHVDQGTLRGGEGAGGIPLHSRAGYDLLLVNILAEVIVAMAPGLSEALREGGTLVASGIILEKAPQVVEALAAQGLAIAQRLDEDGWVALIAQKS